MRMKQKETFSKTMPFNGVRQSAVSLALADSSKISLTLGMTTMKKLRDYLVVVDVHKEQKTGILVGRFRPKLVVASPPPKN
jgi:ribosomal protein S2